jgi:hypothetical protein
MSADIVWRECSRQAMLPTSCVWCCNKNISSDFRNLAGFHQVTLRIYNVFNDVKARNRVVGSLVKRQVFESTLVHNRSVFGSQVATKVGRFLYGLHFVPLMRRQFEELP